MLRYPLIKKQPIHGGTAMVYDAIGNPTEYDNGKYFTNMTWDQGRRLTSLDYGSDTYTYR